MYNNPAIHNRHPLFFSFPMGCNDCRRLQNSPVFAILKSSRTFCAPVYTQHAQKKTRQLLARLLLSTLREFY